MCNNILLAVYKPKKMFAGRIQNPINTLYTIALTLKKVQYTFSIHNDDIAVA